MRNLCTDEVGGVKMKKNAFCNSKKHIFFTALFWLLQRGATLPLCMLTKTKNKNQYIGKLNK